MKKLPLAQRFICLIFSKSAVYKRGWAVKPTESAPTEMMYWKSLITKQTVRAKCRLWNHCKGSFIGSFLNCANVNLLHPSANHFLEVIKLMDKLSLRANLVMDVHLAVLALTTGATLATRDKDFTKIPYLKTCNPLAVKT